MAWVPVMRGRWEGIVENEVIPWMWIGYGMRLSERIGYYCPSKSHTDNSKSRQAHTEIGHLSARLIH